MSIETGSIPLTRDTKIYNDDGMCVIPKDIREKMGVEEGDTVTFVHMDGETRVVKADK